MLATILCLLAGASLAQQQKDPVRDFCRRFGHQTALIDRKLYIDGGFVNWNPLTSDPTNYTNTWLSYQDLDDPGNAGMPQLHADLSKNATVPTVHGGVLWADDVNKKFYLFGGEYFDDQEPPPPESDSSAALYAYDVLFDTWEALPQQEDNNIRRVSYGAGVAVPQKGEAYYYGGWASDGDDRVATAGLVKYVMDEDMWTNGTGPDAARRAEGVLLYIPASDGGMLVYFGGVVDQRGNGKVVGQPMEQIFVYDILSSRWWYVLTYAALASSSSLRVPMLRDTTLHSHQQNATGDVPEMRSRFCAGVTWAPDQSSYNIYIYGGAGMPPSTAGFDDVYILTLPSFTWINFYTGDNSTRAPHNTLSCNVVSGAQMIIIGGTFPLDDTTCDVPDQWGSHNLNLGKQNADGALWYLFDPGLKSYIVPEEITAVVGGGPQGGATKTAPDGGWQQRDLGVYVGRKFTAAERAPTRAVTDPSDSSTLSGGAIAGIVIGCVVALIGFLVGCWWFVRRHRQRQSEEQTADQPAELMEQSGNGPWPPYLPGQPTELDAGSSHLGIGVSPQSPGNKYSSGGASPVHELATPQTSPIQAVSVPDTGADVGLRYGFGPSELSSWHEPSELSSDPPRHGSPVERVRET
ncbi:hypothetical protein F4779DRAFT_613432 [Xylariaceae sp. FL0662B]|nr:hypothetical protein F4779DRAFT_613432 [Xylariaceae sp. FL0662B]